MKPFSGGVIEEAGPALKYLLSMPGYRPIPGSEDHREGPGELERLYGKPRPQQRKTGRILKQLEKEYGI